MKKRILSVLAVLSAALLLPITDVRATSIGEEITDTGRLLTYIYENLSYYLAYDSELRDDTVIASTTENKVQVPDGKGPTFSSINPIVKKVSNPVSLYGKGMPSVYQYADGKVEINPINVDYYTFLGWKYDDNSLFTLGADEKKLERQVVLDKGSSGSRHYTAYWRQNTLDIIYDTNLTKDGEKIKAVIAIDGEADNDNHINGITSTADSNDEYEINEEGKLIKKGDDNSLYAAQHLFSEEISKELIDAADKESLMLYIPDWHLVKGKEWADINGKTYTTGKDYIKDLSEMITKGDAILELRANWEPNSYTITYDVGGNISPNISDKNAVKPEWDTSEKSSKENTLLSDSSTMSIEGSFNDWHSEQAYSVESIKIGKLPVPKRAYYKFAGWYVRESDNSIRDIDKDGQITEDDKVDTYSDILGETGEDHRDITLVAEWEPYTYTIAYHVSDITAFPEYEYNAQVSSETLKNTLTITGRTNITKRGLDKKMSGKSGAVFYEDFNVEATGSLPLVETDYFIPGNDWHLDNEYNDEPITEYIKVSNSIPKDSTDYIADLFFDRKSSDNQTKYTLSCDLGTIATSNVKAASYTTAGYSINKAIGGTHFSNGKQVGEKNTVTYHKMNIILDAKENAPVKADNGALTYDKATVTFTINDIEKDIEIPSLNCHIFDGWYRDDKEIKGYDAFTEDLPAKGTQEYEIVAKWSVGAHDRAEGTLAASNCTKKGIKFTYCKTCGEVSQTADIAALGHVQGAKNTVNPTCTAQGSWNIKCTRCQAVLQSGTIAALGHSMGGWYTAKAATCTAAGQSRRDCARGCGHYETSPINKLGHNDKTVTCDGTGKNHHCAGAVEKDSGGQRYLWKATCNKCGKEFSYTLYNGSTADTNKKHNASITKCSRCHRIK